MSLGVLLALRGEQEERILRLIDAHDDLTVTRRCADAEELLAAAIAGLGTVALVDEEVDVDRPLLVRLTSSGVRTVVLAPASDHARIERLGARAIEAEADVVASLVAESDLPPPSTPQDPGDDAAPGDHGEQGEPADGQVGGQVVCVWGPPGSPGRSSVAINLAHELSVDGARVMLIDADVWGASLAQMLGLLEETSGLAAAIRAADQGTLGAATLGRISRDVAPGLRLIAGLPKSGRWREVTPSSLDAVIETAKQSNRWVVVDTPTLVPDDDYGYQPAMGSHRNQVAHQLLGSADRVLVVGAAEPVGVERLVQALLDLGDLPKVAPQIVAVNRVRSSAAGPRPGDSVREALARFAGITDVELIDDDRAVADQALLSARFWSQVSRKSAAVAGVRAIAHRLSGTGRAGRQRRPRRRTSTSRRAASTPQK